MNTHTPGPWFLNATDGADFTAISTRQHLNSQMDLSVEVLGSSEWLRASEYDLRLMAAAPDLLRAAEQAEEDMGWAESAVPGTNFQAALILIRAAIAKAKGEL